MSRILVIKSSARGSQSASNALADHFKSTYAVKHPEAVFEELDLAAEPLPHLDGEMLGAFFTQANQQSAEQAALAARSSKLIEQLQAADVIVIAFGLYNFSIPSTLKAYIDQVARAGLTFKYTENGPVGLVQGKKVILLVASGGVYTEGPAAAFDFGAPYLKAVLGFLGMTDITVVAAEGLAMAQDQGAAIMAKAQAAVEGL